MNKPAKPTVAIVQRIVPDCRRSFFERVLSHEGDFDVQLVSSDQARNEAHQLVLIAENHKIVPIVYVKELVHLQNSFGFVIKNEIVVIEHAVNSLSNLINFAICWMLRKPYLLWGHGGVTHVKDGAIKRFFKNYLLHFSTGYIGYTERSRRALENWGYDKDKIFIINNSSIDDAKTHIDWNEGLFSDRTVRYVFCGRLTKRKRLNGLVRAFKLVYSQLFCSH